MASVQTSEFARFGPWIDVIDRAEDVPPLYRDYPLDLGAARLVVKVPRNIPRREATADMDLYDHLLVIGDSDLTVLSRVGHDAGPRSAPATRGYTHARIGFDRLAAIEDTVNLLQGRYRVHTLDGDAIALRYSGAARASVALLTAALRERFTVTSGSMPAPNAPVGIDNLAVGGDLALGADLRDVTAAHPGVNAWASHSRRTVAPLGTGLRGAATRMLHAMSPMVLQGCVVAGDGVALELLGRHESMVRGSTPVHSASRLTVSLAALEHVSVTDHPRYAGAAMATLTAGRWSAGTAIPSASDSRRVLERLGTRP